MLEIIKRHFTAYAASNWNDYKADLANDVSYEEIPTRQRMRGAEDYLKVAQRWKRGFPDLRANVLTTVISNDHVVAEVEWEGTHTGPLEGPFGTIQATNKRGNVRAVLVFIMRNNKIVEARHYFDLLTVLTQIGVAPMASMGQAAGTAAAPMTRHP